MKAQSLQSHNRIERCFGCGTVNDQGLGIESYWQENEAVCVWQAKPHHCGAAIGMVHGGVIASLIDCHSVNLAIAHAYRSENRSPGSEPLLQYVTAHLDVSYIKPSPIDKPLHLRAQVLNTEGRKTWVESEITCEGQVCARGKVLAIRVKL
jgi:acyl-coenzyme A thioesterase PaaI-like protein